MQPLSPTDPQWVGSIKLVGLLGQGGMARAYFGRQGDKNLTVKVLRREHLDNSEFVTRFRREIAASRRVRDKATPHVVDSGVMADGTPWFASVYIVGKTLAEKVREAPLSGTALLDFARQLRRILAATHAAGVVHCDVKPGNILVEPNGKAWLIDFGIAHITSHPNLTPPGKVLGSAHYLAPEQLVFGSEPTPAWDVFAYASLLVFASTGRELFGGITREEVAQAIMTAQPDLRDVPDAIRPLVLRCLEKNPKRRATLTEAQRLLPKGPSGMSRLFRQRKDASRGRRRKRLSFWSVFSMILLGMGTIWATTSGAQDIESPAPKLAPAPTQRPEIKVDTPRFVMKELPNTGNPAIHKVQVEGRTLKVTIRFVGSDSLRQKVLTQSCLKVGYAKDRWINLVPNKRSDESLLNVIEFGGALDIPGKVSFFGICDPQATVADGQLLGSIKVGFAGMLASGDDGSGRLMPVVQAVARRNQLTVVLPSYGNMSEEIYAGICLKTKAGPLLPTSVTKVLGGERNYQQLTFARPAGALYWECIGNGKKTRYTGHGVKLP